MTLIIIVIIIQIIVFIKTWIKIRNLQKVFPDTMIWEKTPNNTISSASYANKNMDKILSSINSYLKRYEYSLPDYNIVQDITERHVEKLEESINHTLTVPLFLGLMGTIIGIIIGLGSALGSTNPETNNIKADTLIEEIDSITTNEYIDVIKIDDKNINVDGLIDEVKIAMIASFLGLLLTILNSAWFFNTAKDKLHTNKDVFYDFLLASGLFPNAKGGFGSVLDKMQQYLSDFNKKFSINLNTLQSATDSNRELIETLQKTDLKNIQSMVKYNSEVTERLNTTFDKFEKFNSKFGDFSDKLNIYSTTIVALVEKLGDFTPIVEGTEDLKTAARRMTDISQKMNDSTEQSYKLIEYLTKTFDDLDKIKDNSIKASQNAIGEVNKSIINVFGNLEERIKHIDLAMGTAIEKEIIQVTGKIRETFAQLETQVRHIDSVIKEAMKENVDEKIKSVGDGLTGTFAELETQIKNISVVIQPITEDMENSFTKILESTRKLENGLDKSLIETWAKEKLEGIGKEIELKLQSILSDAVQKTNLQKEDLEKNIKETMDIIRQISKNTKPRGVLGILFRKTDYET